MTPRWIIAIELAVGLGVVAFMLSPVLLQPNEQLAGTLDAPYHAWLGWRIGELWGEGSFLTLSIPDAFSPQGFDLRLVDGLLPAWVTALFNVVTGHRMIVSYNLALAVGVALDVWAAFALARVLTSRRWICLVCGVAFASAPALAASLGAHIAFVYAFALPLLVREAIVLARGDDERRAPWARIGIVLVVAYLCSSYHLIFGSIAFAMVALTWPRSAARSKVGLLRMGAAFAVAFVVLSPFVVARLSYEAAERDAGSSEVVRSSEGVALSADAFGAITPPDTMWLDVPVPRADLGPQLYAPLRPAFVGYVLMAGIIGLAWTRIPARRPLLITAAALWVLSLGPALHVAGRAVGASEGTPAADAPQWLPYRLLQSVPGLGALRAPTRASYALAAVLTAALAVALDRVADRVEDRVDDRRRSGQGVDQGGAAGADDAAGAAAWWPTAALVGAVAVLLLFSITSPVPTSDLGLTADTTQGLEQVAARSAGATGTADGLLLVPWGCRLDDPRIVAMQSIHRRPNVGCNPPPAATPWFSGLDAWAASAELAALRCDQSHIDRRPVPFDGSARLGGADGVARLRRDLGVRYVVLDLATLPPFGCDSVRDAMAVLRRYEVVSDDGAWAIVDLDRPLTSA